MPSHDWRNGETDLPNSLHYSQPILPPPRKTHPLGGEKMGIRGKISQKSWLCGREHIPCGRTAAFFLARRLGGLAVALGAANQQPAGIDRRLGHRYNRRAKPHSEVSSDGRRDSWSRSSWVDPASAVGDSEASSPAGGESAA